MPQEYTREQLKAMSGAELVKLYNSITNKSVKRFSTRQKGVEAVLAELAKRATTNAPVNNGARTVSKTKVGRPIKDFSVKLAEGKSSIRETSLRGQIMAHLKPLAKDAQTSIIKLEEKFGEKTRAAVQKLIATGWLARCE